jgi:hypothetical protein
MPKITKAQPSLANAIEEFTLENLMVLERWNAAREAEREPKRTAQQLERERFKRWKELVGEYMRDRRRAEERARRDPTIIPGDPGG